MPTWRNGKRRGKPEATRQKSLDKALQEFLGDTAEAEAASETFEGKRRGPKPAPPEEQRARKIRRAFERFNVDVPELWGRKIRGISGYHEIPPTEVLRQMIEAALDGKVFVPKGKAAQVELKQMQNTLGAQERLKEAAMARARARGEMLGAGNGVKLPFGLNDPRLADDAGGGHGDDGSTPVPR